MDQSELSEKYCLNLLDKLTEIDGKLKELSRTMDEGFTGIEQGFDQLNERVDEGFSEMKKETKSIDSKLSGIERQV